MGRDRIIYGGLDFLILGRGGVLGQGKGSSSLFMSKEVVNGNISGYWV